MRVCAWCGIRFLAWSTSEQSFCKPGHAKKARDKRRKDEHRKRNQQNKKANS